MNLVHEASAPNWRLQLPAHDDPELPTLGPPSPWDPAYLLSLRYETLKVSADCLPILGSVPAIRERLNTLVADKHKKEHLHHWVNQAADQLRQAGFNIGIAYSIVGSAARQVLGGQWLQEVLHNCEQNTGAQLGELMAWAGALSFTRNDIDARIYISLGDMPLATAMRKIEALFSGLSDCTVQKQWAGNAVLIKRGHWDLYIPLKSQRRHIFDADACEIHIPFNLDGRDPWLNSSCGEALVKALLFETLDTSKLSDLNAHMWRAMLYQGVKGRRIARSEVLQAIYSECLPVPASDFQYQLSKSCAEHGMPPASSARQLFLLQVILDLAPRAPLARQQLHGRTSVWSRAVQIAEPEQMQAGLTWLALLALKENWQQPFLVRLAERAGKVCLRINVDSQVLWLPLDRELLKSCDCSAAWPLLKALEWSSIKRGSSPLCYLSELDPVLHRYAPELPAQTAFQQVIRWRWLYVDQRDVPALDWDALADSHVCLEDALFAQVRELNSEFWMQQLLPLLSGRRLSEAVMWRISYSSKPLEKHWLGDTPWRLLLNKTYDRAPLAAWALRYPLEAFKQLDQALRHEILEALCTRQLRLDIQLKALLHCQAERTHWDSIFRRKDLSQRADAAISAALKCGRSHDAQRICLLAIEQRQDFKAAQRLLDQRIAEKNVHQALQIWSACLAAKRLDGWSNDWSLLLLLDHCDFENFPNLLERCSQQPCPDLQAWGEKAKLLRGSWNDRSAHGRKLLSQLLPECELLFPLYLAHKPRIREAAARWPAEQSAGLLIESLSLYVPLLLECETLDSSELARAARLVNQVLPHDRKQALTPLIGQLIDYSVATGQLPDSDLCYIEWLRRYPDLRFLWLIMSLAQRSERLLGLSWWQELAACARQIAATDYQRSVRYLLPVITEFPQQSMELLEKSSSCFERESFCEHLLSQAFADEPLADRLFACDAMQPWIEAASALAERTSSMSRRLKLTKYLLAWSLHPKAPKSALQALQERTAALVRLCGDDREISHTAPLMLVLQAASMKGCELPRLEAAFTLIMRSAPSKLDMSCPLHRQLLLLAAQNCHLMMHGFLKAASKSRGCHRRLWARLGEISHGARVAHKHMNLVREALDARSCPPGNPPSELTKAALLLNPGQWHFPDALKLKVLYEAADLLLWAGEQVESAPALENWMLRFADNLAETMGDALDDKGIGRAFNAIAAFFISDQEIESEKRFELCQEMILRWGQLRYWDLKQCWAERIICGLKHLGYARFTKLFRISLIERCLEHHPIIRQLEALLGEQQDVAFLDKRVNFAQDRYSSVQDSGLNTRFLGRLTKCRNFAYVGCGVMSLSPAAHGVNYIAGQKLPGVTLLAEKGIQAGLSIVGLATAGMALLVILTISMIVRDIFRGR